MSRAFVVTDRGRAVRQAVLDGFAAKATSLQLDEQDAFEGLPGLYAPRFDPALFVKLLEVNTAHAVACRQKAEDTVGIGWRFDRIDPDAPERDRERLEEFFGEGPPPATAREQDDVHNVLEAASFDFEAIGRGAIELVRRDHEASAPLERIVHVPSHTLRLHRDGLRFVQIKGAKRRWFKWAGADVDVDFRTGEVTRLGRLRPAQRATEIAWWTRYHPADPIYGLPDIIPAIGPILGDLGRRDYNIEFFANFGVPAYAVFVTGDFDPGPVVDGEGNEVPEDDPNGKTELEWQIERMFDEVRDNPHSNMVFVLPTRDGVDDGEVKIQFQPLATEVKEASFRLYRQDNREEVLSAHQMSAAIAGVFNAGAANREAIAAYKRSVVQPRQRDLERIVNTYIVRGGLGVRGWRWRLLTVDTRDVERELGLWLQMLDKGVVTLRQFLRHFGEPLGLEIPPEGEDPETFDVRRTPSAPAPAADDPTARVLREMRDDLVTMARKAATNGRDRAWLEGLLT